MKRALVDKIIALSYDTSKILSDPLTEEEILEVFQEYGAVWLHNGSSEKPHAELTSGKHSNGFFNCPRVLCDTKISSLFARQLAYNLETTIAEGVDWVVGSPYSAIAFSYEVARILGANHGFPRKDPSDPKKMIWKDWQIPEGSRILQIEELITTLGTTMKVREAIKKDNRANVFFHPVVGSVVHRPPELPVHYENGICVVSLLERAVWAVEANDCPLCAQGSKALRPRTHWNELTA